MWRRYILAGILIIFSLVMGLGDSDARSKKAAFFGRTIFFPLVSSIKTIEFNAELQTENFVLRSSLTETTLENIALQNQLKELIDVSSIRFSTESAKFELAEVIGYSGAFYQRNLIVNKGRIHGIMSGSAVISGGGIVGKVISVSDTYSIILPFSNPNFQLPVMDTRTGVQGILQSDVSGTISMNLVKLGSEIASGDTVVTSNLSRLFPKGYPVGVVNRTRETRDNLFISAEINPFTLVENLEHVFILMEKNHETEERNN